MQKNIKFSDYYIYITNKKINNIWVNKSIYLCQYLKLYFEKKHKKSLKTVQNKGISYDISPSPSKHTYTNAKYSHFNEYFFFGEGFLPNPYGW